MSGAVNGTAPEPVTNAEFTRVLGSVLHRPTFVPVPGWAPAVLLGARGADELALADQRVLPRTLTDAGHQVVAETDTAEGLVKAVAEQRPDFALVDVRLPPSFSDEGIRAAVLIRAQNPGVALLVLSGLRLDGTRERRAKDAAASPVDENAGLDATPRTDA